MSSDKTTGNGVIVAWVPGLENTPGWLSLSRKKQDALLEHTSHIQQNRQLQKFGEFGELMELQQVQQLLEGEDMKMGDYLLRLYPGRNKRTIGRKREAYAEFCASVPAPVLKRLASASSEMLDHYDRIAHAALGDIRNAAKELMQLPASTEKDADKYLEALDSKLLEHRQLKRKGKALHRDESYATKMATNEVINYMRSCGLKTSQQKRKFLTRVIGWVMEAQAVGGGLLRAGRITIPDGIIIKRGRPRIHPRKEAA